MDGSTSFGGFRIPNVLGDKTILPTYPSSSKGGRPRRNLRGIVDAIFYRLRTGCQWKAIPSCFAPGSTAHQYFQEWVSQGVFDAIWQLALQEYDDLIGLEWDWQSADCAMTKSPLCNEKTGKNPTDRGKKGTKRSLITEAAGIPVGLSVGGANTHDVHLLRSTLEDCLRRVSNKKYTIAMARTNDPDSANAQFFINLVDNGPLDPNVRSAGYAVFGQVVEGTEIVEAIGKVKTGNRGFHQDVPVEPITIESISVVEASK